MASTVKCPFCAEEVLKEAKKCKHCGEFLDEQLRVSRTAPDGTAAVLDAIVPGLGDIKQGNIGKGISSGLAIGLGYFFFIVPGIILHLRHLKQVRNNPLIQARRAAMTPAQKEGEKARQAQTQNQKVRLLLALLIILVVTIVGIVVFAILTNQVLR